VNAKNQLQDQWLDPETTLLKNPGIFRCITVAIMDGYSQWKICALVVSNGWL
jgi:non-ribosomal peptide synthetase component E (peptide arylation enzyme)